MTSAFEDKIKSSLDNSLDGLDNETLQRLHRIRRDALNQPNHQAWWSSLNTWVPAAGFAMCSLIAAVLWLPQLNNSTPSIAPLDQTAMMELIESPDALDVLDDPGFYLWLDESDEQHV